MPTALVALLVTFRSIIRPRVDLQLENLALRHQIGMLQRSVEKRPRLTSSAKHAKGGIARSRGGEPLTCSVKSRPEHRSRTPLSLGKDSPEPRPILPLGVGPVVALPQGGGLHHRYERVAA
jgi:hypothetical protein